MDAHGACILLLLTIVHCSLCEDFVTDTITKSSESESISQSMPENVTVNVTIGGQDVRLDLKLDRNASSDIPVYIFSTNKDGQAETKRVHRKRSKQFAVYRDVTHGALFSGRRDVETDQGHLSLEGLLQMEGKVYDIKSTKRRHRNSTAAMGDGKTGSQSHNVQPRDVGGEESAWSDHNEAGENQTFVVRLRDDLPPRSLRGDAIFPPIREEKKQKKIKSFMDVELQQAEVTASLAAAPPMSQQQSGRRDVYIDVVAVADYGVFTNWYANSSGVTHEEKVLEVLDKLPEYYTFMFSGVNMLYEGISSSLFYSLHVKLAAIVIATRPADSPWTESLRKTSSPWDEVDSHKALESFSVWAAGADILPTYDHLTLFSGYDLTQQNPIYWFITDKDLLGVAYIGKLCSSDGTSVVEDRSSFESIFVVAHEMGHSEYNHNIMAAGFAPNDASDRHSLWQFSSCSVSYFNTFIRQKVSTSRGQQCLYNTVTPNKYIPDVSGQQPGQVYDYDAQCRQVFGPQSRLCRGQDYLLTPSKICMSMYCDNVEDDKCRMFIAARGTSCGNKKWCVNGDCVYDSRAPPMDEKCPFGDMPGLVYQSQTCVELTASNPHLCYNNDYLGRCCSSCAKYSRPVQGCQYGDRTTGCNRSTCSWNFNNCCETCSTGMHFNTTSTTSTTTTSGTTVTTTSNGPMSTGDGVNSSFSGMCEDTSSKVRGKTCADLVTDLPASCYDSHVTASCCASCQKRSTGVKGCEFGDKYPSQCSFAIASRSTCGWLLQQICCQTCTDNPKTTPGYNVDFKTTPGYNVGFATGQSPAPVASSLIAWLWMVISLLHRLLSF